MMTYGYMKNFKKPEIEMIRTTEVFHSWTGKGKPPKTLIQFAYDFIDPDAKAVTPSKEMRHELTLLLRWMKTGRPDVSQAYEFDDMFSDAVGADCMLDKFQVTISRLKAQADELYQRDNETSEK